jgi:hypothetical protein
VLGRQDVEVSASELGAWQPLSLLEVRHAMGAATFPWWIAGGWAIDLFVGRQTREHGDIDVGVFRCDQDALRTVVADWDVQVATGGRLRPWRAEELLDPPDNDLWVKERSGGPWRFQVMLNEGASETWVFRRDPEIRVSLDEAVRHSEDGTPYLASHLQLLFKAKAPRPRDEADVAEALPRMTPEDRTWLLQHLLRLDPSHPWRERFA